MKFFITDTIATTLERYEEAEQESKDFPEDLFKSGKALAYQEVKEIIENRLAIYEITEKDLE
ncbi:MAG: hypothetical protein V3G42_08400 [Oscillospiraceae bacterium]